MNKSVMKCCICNNENIGQFITINNKKYHLCCIEQLKQENKQLEDEKKKNQPLIDLANKYKSENRILKIQNTKLKKKVGDSND